MLGDDVGYGTRERADDFSRVLSELIDLIVVRSKKHATVVEVARHATCPVINGLTDQAHPCQALADLYTVREAVGTLDGVTIAWVGDANNVARSLALACGRMGVHLAVASPIKYQFGSSFLEMLKHESPDMKLTMSEDPHEVVSKADAIYTDVWTSMGQEKEAAKRRHDFADYQVNCQLMKSAPENAVFLHCLPAKRGEEVTNEVIDGPRSIVVQQAGNRMHVQKGIVMWLLSSRK